MTLVAGTATTTAVALLVAIPLGTVIAIYLSEFASHRLRETVKPILELLGAVPTVVFGYFALLVVTPLLQRIYPDLPGFNMLSAGLVMGVMIIPYISSVAEDAMRAVPMHLREGSYAMGATKLQTALRVVVPGAFSGLAAAYILGISRAIGETMVVLMVAGGAAAIPRGIFDSVRPMPASIAAEMGEAPFRSGHYHALFATGIVLFAITLASMPIAL